MHITTNRSLANTLPWKIRETCGNAADHVARISQPVFETLSWTAASLCSLATLAMNASIFIGKRSPSKACIISLLVLESVSGTSTPSSTPMAPANISDFLINSYTNGNQRDHTTAPFPDSSFVETWYGEGPDDNVGIFGQRFFANGSAWGSEFRANTYTNGSQYVSSTAAFSDGSFVVTWAGEGTGDSSGIFGQHFFANGSGLGSEFRANNYTNGEQRNPSTAAFSDGSFIVTWEGEGAGNDSGIFGQRFFANGSACGSEFRVNNYMNGNQWDPATAAFSDGTFVVTWWGEGAGDSFGIFGQRFFANGSAWGEELRANNYTNGDQWDPNTATFSDGSFVVTWYGEGAGDSFGIFGQRFFANGSVWGSEFRANNYTNGDQWDPETATFSDGSFVVTWYGEGDGDSLGIFGQRFFANGSAWGEEFRTNSHTNGNQYNPSTTTFSDGSFIVTWQGEETPGSSVYNIYGKRFDMSGQPIPWERTSFSPSLSMQTTTSNLNTLTITSPLFNSASPSFQSTSPSSFLTFSSSLRSSDDFISFSSQSRKTTATSQSSIPPITTFAYEESYPIIVNGETIGTFTFTGGIGQFDSNNDNTLNIQLDPDLTIEDGDTLTLFTFAGDTGSFENIIINGGNDECIEAEGEVIENPDGTKNYQAVITKTNSCLTAGSRMLRSSLSLLSVYVPEK